MANFGESKPENHSTKVLRCLAKTLGYPVCIYMLLSHMVSKTSLCREKFRALRALWTFVFGMDKDHNLKQIKYKNPR